MCCFGPREKSFSLCGWQYDKNPLALLIKCFLWYQASYLYSKEIHMENNLKLCHLAPDSALFALLGV